MQNFKFNVNVMELKNKILNFVNLNGPILPAQASRTAGCDILLASAILSELISYGQVKITKAKIGGSPLYYVSGQEAKLQMLESHLSDVPRKAFGLLREKKVVWDRQCSPAERVALREINDFAFPVKIKMPSGEEIFWKWYLLDDKQAEQMIAGIYGAEKAIEKEIAPMKKDLTEKQMQTALTPTAALLLAEAEKTEHGKQSEKREDRKELPIEKKEEKHRQKQEGGFEMLVWNFLKKRQLEHIEHKMIKKNKEMNIIIKMPSAIGELYYFIKAKDKKRVNDADLSLAYSESQRHNMPLLFLSGGELTVKAKRLIEEQMKGIAFKKL